MYQDQATFRLASAAGPNPAICLRSDHAKKVKNVIKARRNRATHFDAEMFSDPAWDILLELYAAELQQAEMSVSAIGVMAGVPATTALRWLSMLTAGGLIRRREDPLDRRRVYVTLSPEGGARMRRYFDALPDFVAA